MSYIYIGGEKMSVLEQLQQEIEQMRDSYERRRGGHQYIKVSDSCYAYSFMVYLSEQGLEVKLVEE